ncbi:MAG: metal-dependent hydrolase [Gemmatimonadota bacterium]
MFAVDHAATALLLKRRYPSVPLAPILIAVQAMELGWVLLNYLGIERTTTDAVVRSVSNIHLAYMPYSHSVATALAAAALAWLALEKGWGRKLLGRAVGLGIISHLILDLLTHAHDIVLWPGKPAPAFGLGFYGAAPLAAFALEMIYGVVCWWIYRGRRGLLALIVVGNLANLSLLSAAVPGPEAWLAGRPLAVVSVIAVQIIVTLVLVGILARHTRSDVSVFSLTDGKPQVLAS